MRSWADPLTRFQLKVYPHGDCLRWHGFTNAKGYGLFGYNGEAIMAHRFAYEVAFGTIPTGLHIDHLCRNKWCVRPSHLDVVTPAENTRRADPGKINRNKTHCRHGHEFTPENTVTEQVGQRACRTCRRKQKREAATRFRAKRRAGTCAA